MEARARAWRRKFDRPYHGFGALHDITREGSRHIDRDAQFRYGESAGASTLLWSTRVPTFLPWSKRVSSNNSIKPVIQTIARPDPMVRHLLVVHSVAYGFAKIRPATDLTDARPIDRKRSELVKHHLGARSPCSPASILR